MFALWLLQSVLIPQPPQREANFSIFFHFLPLTSPPPLSLPPFSSSIITFLSQQISYSKSLKKKKKQSLWSIRLKTLLLPTDNVSAFTQQG